MERMDANNRITLTERTVLHNVVPIQSPINVYIDVSSACNFKCNFCHQSLEQSGDHPKFTPKIMDFDLYKQIIDELSEFQDRLKNLILTGVGEPTMNTFLPQMIEYAKKKHVANKIYFATNASLLTNALSDKLINAGLDEIIISLEGLSEETYLKVTGCQIDFEHFVENIRYFYENRKQCKVFIKTIDISIKNREEFDEFKRIFEPISDLVYMENILPMFEGVNYKDLKDDYSASTRGNGKFNIDVCPNPFYILFISPSGNVLPCCRDVYESIIFGNVKNQSLPEIWNGKTRKKFLLTHLKKQRDHIGLCSNCQSLNFLPCQEDILDNHTQELIKKFEDNK